MWDNEPGLLNSAWDGLIKVDDRLSLGLGPLLTIFFEMSEQCLVFACCFDTPLPRLNSLCMFLKSQRTCKTAFSCSVRRDIRMCHQN
jgi:hypothetical protein